MKTWSLTRRILAIVLMAQVACALTLSVSALLHEQHTRLRAFDETLRGRSDSLLGAVQDAEDPDDNVTIDSRELKLPKNDVYAVYNADGHVIGSSEGAPAEVVRVKSAGYRGEIVTGITYRVYQRNALRIIDRAENGGVGLSRPVTIVYASPETHLKHEIVEAAQFYVVLIVLLAACTGLGVILFVKRALRPLRDLTETAGKLSASSLLFSPPASALEVAELRPLTSVLSAVTQGLRQAFEKERRFVGDAAHELKTAVAVVRSTIQLLMLKPRSGAEYGAGLGRALEDNSRVELLISQMLSSSGADDTAYKLLPVINLAASVESTLANLAPVAAALGVALHREGAEETWVRLRPDRASALISNLVLNAIQHSERESAVTVVIESTVGGTVGMRVIDTGAGIRSEAVPHVFERFYREDRSRSRETGGSGLGLAICKSIVEGAGGTIEIESALDEGTTITVSFMKA